MIDSGIHFLEGQLAGCSQTDNPDKVFGSGPFVVFLDSPIQ